MIIRNSRLIGELVYYISLLPLVLDADKVLQSLVAENFITAEEKENIAIYISNERKVNNFIKFLVNKCSGDWSTFISTLQKCQQFQVLQIIIKILTIITNLKHNSERTLSIKALFSLDLRLNADVLCHLTELNLFNWTTIVNLQHNTPQQNYCREFSSLEDDFDPTSKYLIKELYLLFYLV